MLRHLGLPLVVALVRARWRGGVRRLALAAIVAVASVDNLTWCAVVARSQRESFYSPQEADLLARLDAAGVRGVAVAPEPLGYLLGT